MQAARFDGAVVIGVALQTIGSHTSRRAVVALPTVFEFRHQELPRRRTVRCVVTGGAVEHPVLLVAESGVREPTIAGRLLTITSLDAVRRAEALVGEILPLPAAA